ncbi:MAG TPA: CBS domain-containing protein [Gemmatimonadales bacterium]|nr:CBS domain-containing protein [Gemmatimonadales bacterium]
MTKDPACCTPTDTVQHAARLLLEYDCGCLPVVEDQQSRRLVGVVTDRDITCRSVARGWSPDTSVEAVMSPDPVRCSPEADIREVERIMVERQVRRVPVEDGDGCCIGIVAQADLALAEDRGLSDREVGRVVEQISRPAQALGSEAGARPELRM